MGKKIGFAMNRLRAFARKVPGAYVVAGLPRLLWYLLKCRSLRTVLFAPPGHFYSPLPDIRYLKKRRERIFPRGKTPEDIDLRPDAQLALLDVFAKLYAEHPFPPKPTAGFRYYYENTYYGCGDSLVLYGFLRHARPRRVIEVGSGFSSAVMLDVNDRFFDGSIRFTFIEPYPGRLLGLIGEADRSKHEVIAKVVQDVPVETFTSLGENDLLFIDSSHVVKVGSDVHHLLFEVLPAVKPGVIIHFHDIHWPMQYPESWVMQGRAYNETYFLRMLLRDNPQYRVEYFNTYMTSCHREALAEKMPLCLQEPGGGLWLRKVAPPQSTG